MRSPITNFSACTAAAAAVALLIATSTALPSWDCAEDPGNDCCGHCAPGPPTSSNSEYSTAPDNSIPLPGYTPHQPVCRYEPKYGIPRREADTLIAILSAGGSTGQRSLGEPGKCRTLIYTMNRSEGAGRISLCAEKEETANLQREWPPTELASQAKKLLKLCSDNSTELVGGKLNFPGQYQNFYVFLDTQDTPPS